MVALCWRIHCCYRCHPRRAGGGGGGGQRGGGGGLTLGHTVQLRRAGVRGRIGVTGRFRPTFADGARSVISLEAKRTCLVAILQLTALFALAPDDHIFGQYLDSIGRLSAALCGQFPTVSSSWLIDRRQ